MNKSGDYFWLYLVGLLAVFIGVFVFIQSSRGRDLLDINGRNSGSSATSTPRPTNNDNPDQPNQQYGIDINKDYYAIIETSEGELEVDLYEKAAPNTVANFISLSNNNYYQDKKFLKTILGSIMQLGDDSLDSNAGYTIPDEINWDSLDYQEELRIRLRRDGYQSVDKIASKDLEKYSLVMANPEPNSASTQFIILLNDLNDPVVSALQGRSVAFGKMIAGEDVLLKIENKIQQDINSVTLRGVKVYYK